MDGVSGNNRTKTMKTVFFWLRMHVEKIRSFRVLFNRELPVPQLPNSTVMEALLDTRTATGQVPGERKTRYKMLPSTQPSSKENLGDPDFTGSLVHSSQ